LKSAGWLNRPTVEVIYGDGASAFAPSDGEHPLSSPSQVLVSHSVLVASNTGIKNIATAVPPPNGNASTPRPETFSAETSEIARTEVAEDPQSAISKPRNSNKKRWSRSLD
jgi:hypothetical protein